MALAWTDNAGAYTFEGDLYAGLLAGLSFLAVNDLVVHSAIAPGYCAILDGLSTGADDPFGVFERLAQAPKYAELKARSELDWRRCHTLAGSIRDSLAGTRC